MKTTVLEQIKNRLEQIRTSIESESISYEEIVFLQNHVDVIDKSDIQLLEWAGVEENV